MPRDRALEEPPVGVLEVTAPLALVLGPAAPVALVLGAVAPVEVVLGAVAPVAVVLEAAAPVALVLGAVAPVEVVLGAVAPVAVVLEAAAPVAGVLGAVAPVDLVLGAAVPRPVLDGATLPLALVLEPAPPTALDIRGVLRYLPHRYPMLLVDRVEALVPGVSATGIKCVTVNEPYMAGHFPGYPIMPGVLIVDALAQVGGIMLRSAGAPAPPHAAAQGGESRPGVLASIQRMRFLRQVLPGDRLSLKVRLQKSFGSLHQVAVEASVGGDVAATGELVLAS